MRQPIITHEATQSDDDTTLHALLTKREAELRAKEQTVLPVEETIKLLHQLGTSPLGRFLLQNKGLNGAWTAYIILDGPQKTDLPPLERWMLHTAPVVRATRERFHIFREVLQRFVQNDVVMASVPCGRMDDLLGLDFTGVQGVQLVGMDLDPESLDLARQQAICYGGQQQITLKKGDAWDLGVEGAYDVLTSNGLNIYVPEEERVMALYEQFYKALKKGGYLVTSFLTPPPTLSPDSTSTWHNVSMQDALKQRAIFADIIEASWQTFRTEAQMRQHLVRVGFEVEEVIYDTQGMFPTILARK